MQISIPSDPLHRKLIGALVGLSRAASGREYDLTDDTHHMVLEALSALSTGADSSLFDEIIERIHAEKARLAPDCSVCPHPCGRTSDMDMDELRLCDEKILSLRLSILFELISTACDIPSSSPLPEDCLILYEALSAIADGWYENYLTEFEQKLRAFHEQILKP